MHGKVKLTKRQIKEDKFATFMFSAREQVTANWQYWAIGTVAVILACVAVVFVVRNIQSSKSEIGQKLSTALMEYRSGNTQVAVLSLTQLVEDAKDADIAKQALFMLGRISFEQKNYADANKYWEQYAQKYKDDKFNSAAAIAGVAAGLENQGQFPQAAAKFAEAIAIWPTGPAAGDYQLSAMRCSLEGGDVAKARTYLTDIKTTYKNTELAIRATRLFAEKSGGQTGS
jgi:TolA-binding protein